MCHAFCVARVTRPLARQSGDGLKNRPLASCGAPRRREEDLPPAWSRFPKLNHTDGAPDAGPHPPPATAVAGFRHGVFYQACRCDCCRYGGRRLLDRPALPFLDAARPPLPDDLTEESAVVEKSARRWGLFNEGQRLRAYRVAVGHGGIAPEEREGDALPGRDRRSPQSAQLLPPGAPYRLSERLRMRSRRSASPPRERFRRSPLPPDGFPRAADLTSSRPVQAGYAGSGFPLRSRTSIDDLWHFFNLIHGLRFDLMVRSPTDGRKQSHA